MPEDMVEELVAQGVPPEEAMMMAYPEGPPPEMMGAPMGPEMGMEGPPPPPMAPPGSEDEMLAMLLEQVIGKWSGDQAQLAGEKGALMDTLMMIAQAAGALPPEAMYAEGAPMPGPMMPAEAMPPEAMPY